MQVAIDPAHAALPGFRYAGTVHTASMFAAQDEAERRHPGKVVAVSRGSYKRHVDGQGWSFSRGLNWTVWVADGKPTPT